MRTPDPNRALRPTLIEWPQSPSFADARTLAKGFLRFFPHLLNVTPRPFWKRVTESGSSLILALKPGCVPIAHTLTIGI